MQNFGHVMRKKIFLRVVSQHAHQRGIHVQDVARRIDDVDAFLQRFKEFREARFILPQRADIARQNGDSVNRVSRASWRAH